MDTMTSPFGIADLEAHTDTRLALQSVAEHVLAADLHHHLREQEARPFGAKE